MRRSSVRSNVHLLPCHDVFSVRDCSCRGLALIEFVIAFNSIPGLICLCKSPLTLIVKVCNDAATLPILLAKLDSQLKLEATCCRFFALRFWIGGLLGRILNLADTHLDMLALG